MSDRQKGLKEAVKDIFPSAAHRFCCRHLYSNFKKEFPGLTLKKDFWNAAKATHGYEFWLHMRNMKSKKEQKPHDWLLKIPLSHWSRHAFWTTAKCDNYTNNFTESFNSWIGNLRGLPIIQIIEKVRQKCMLRFHERYEKAATWQGKVTPRIQKTLRQIINQSRCVKLIPGRNDEFECHEGPCRFAVSLERRTCSCGWWDISGLPCKHAVRAIGYKRAEIEDFCDEYFTISTYKKVYQHAIHLIPQRDLQPDEDHPPMQPPPLKRQPGRPKKARRREDGEACPAPKRTRNATVVIPG
ncbi:uncharacterized protein LOC110607965 [Manihot esculenta]|uniref:uncharacterized protein LOC110607965 n=1 Tax=Manihot esculenta TaxID=3983 RepID=UPI000B5D4589|nr:uncharacterized protein LOC110607965 [Manihot esculenta]